MRIRIPRIPCAVAIAIVAVLLGSTIAFAHTVYEGSDPSEGSSLDQAPKAVTLTFSDDVVGAVVKVRLVDSAGQTVTLTPGAVSVAKSHVVVRLTDLPHDTYRLAFSVRDSADLHETAGSMVFAIGQSVGTRSSAAAEPATNPAEAATRWISLAGLAILIGALLFALGLLPRRVKPSVVASAQVRQLDLAIIGAVILLTGETSLLAVQAAVTGLLGTSLPTLILDSQFGQRWLALVALETGLLVTLLQLRKRLAGEVANSEAVGRVWRPAFGVGLRVANGVGIISLLLVVVLAVGGHSGADAAPTPMGVALRAAHLLSVSLWGGGIVALAVLVQAERQRLRGLTDILKSFSAVAAVSLTAAVVSGLLLSGREITSVTALLSTGYGLTLIAKCALVMVLGGLGLSHAVAIRRGIAPKLWTVGMEAGGVLAVILLAGILAATAPALGKQFDPPTQVPTTSVSVPAADLLVRISVEPNRPGRNLVTATVANTRHPIPAPIGGVTLVVSRPGQPDATRTAQPVTDHPGQYDAGAIDLAPGDLRVTARIVRTGLAGVAEQTAEFHVLPASSPRHPTVVSAAAYPPLALGLAAILSILAMATLVFLRLQAFRRIPVGRMQAEERLVQVKR